MIQRKRTKFSLLPSDDPVTMKDKYDSFVDQFFYDIDFEQPSDNITNNFEKTSVCAVWPRPRFMLQINAPPKGIQSFYQNKLNLMPMINRGQATAPISYQKRKVHSIRKEDNFNQSNMSISNSQNNFLQLLNQTSDELNIGSLRQNDQSYPLPKFQINTSHLSNKNQNSAEFLPPSQNNTTDSTQIQSFRTNDQSQDNENEENHSISDQILPLTSSKSQPQLVYHNQTSQQTKSKIMQRPIAIPGLQFAFQHSEQLLKLAPFQQIQKLQSANKIQPPRQTQTQKTNQNEIGANNETIKNTKETESEDTNQNLQLAQNDPNAQKKKKTKPRQSFTPEQKMLLEKFIFDHIDHPYAEHDDLVMLEKQTNLSKKQIRVFMTNTRMRKFAGNKIPVLKKSGNIVMRKGVPLHGPLGRVDPKSQCFIQCFTKKMNIMKMPMNMPIQQDLNQQYNRLNESQNYQINEQENEAFKRSNSK